eukprot:Em0012g1066a
MDCTSEYMYDRQPPAIIACNPYINQVLLLDCAIAGPGPVQLHWYFSPTLDPLLPVLIINSSRYELQDMSESNTTTRVGLAVRSLNAPTENVTAGYYWCQGTVPRGELTPSMKVKLERADYYKNIMTCYPKTYIRSSDKGCPIVLSQPDTSTLSTTPPEPSQVATTIPMATQSTERLPTPWQATSTASGANNDSEGSGTPTKSTASTDAGQGLFDPALFSVRSSNTWLYIILGVSAISLLVIVVLGVVIFSMCRRHVRKEASEFEGMNANREKLSEHSVAAGALGFKTGSTPLPPPPPHRHIPYYQQTMDVHLPHISSEDYAEVGPVRGDQRLHVSHDYSEIREFLPEGNVHLSTSGQSAQHQVLLSSAQPSAALQSHDCHTPEGSPTLLPTSTFMTHNLSMQFCDVVSANGNEGDAMDDHTYHILQLSGYSSSDNTSEVDAAAKAGSAGTQEGIVVTVPIPHLGGPDLRGSDDTSGLTTPRGACVSTGLVGLLVTAIPNTTDGTTGEGYSQLVKIPTSGRTQGGAILLAPQDDEAYSHLVRAMEVAPQLDNSRESEGNPTANIQNAPTIVVGSAMDDHISNNADLADLTSSHLMFPTDGHHLAPCNLPMFLGSPSDLTDRGAGNVMAPVSVTTAQNGIVVTPQGVTTAPQGVATAPQGVATTQQGVATIPQGTTAEEASMPALPELSKYNGDYERDSAYMGALQWVPVRQSTTDVDQLFPNNAHHVTTTMLRVQDNGMCQSMESLYPEAHLYQALMSRTKEKSKQYTDLRLGCGDQPKPCTDLLVDGDQSKQCMGLQLDGDQFTRHIDLQLYGDQSRQYRDLQLDSNH